MTRGATILIDVDGEKIDIAAIAERTGKSFSSIYKRYRKFMAGKLTKEELHAPGRTRSVKAGESHLNLEMIYAVNHLPMNALRPVDDDDDEIREDYFTWYITKVHPDGITLEQLAELIGVTKERVRQIEVDGLRNFAVNARAMGFDVREMMQALIAERGGRHEVLD